MKSVLLIRPDKAGDALKTLPVLRALTLQDLPYELQLLGSFHNASLFNYEPGIQFHCLPKNWEQLEKHTLRTLLETAFPEPFEFAILLPCDSFPETDRLLEVIPSKYKSSTRQHPLPLGTPAKREETKNIATLVGNTLSVELIPLIYEVPRPPIFLESDLEEAKAQMGEKKSHWLGFCPFAGTTHRTHPLKSWLKLIRKVTKQNSFEKYFIFGAEGDRKNMEILRKAAKDESKVFLCFPSSFRTLGAYLKRLDGVVAVDSGPLHLAHTLEIPSLGILSGGDVERWFKRIYPKDLLIPRGLFSRYPTVFEIFRNFKKWKMRLSLPEDPYQA